MNPKSGVFTTPVAGSYLFQIHVCTLDLHKALLSIRLNGREVACFYDQVGVVVVAVVVIVVVVVAAATVVGSSVLEECFGFGF